MSVGFQEDPTVTTESSTHRAAAPARLEKLRRWLFVLLWFSMVGTVIELFLLEHTEDAMQWLPLIGIAVAAVATALLQLRPSRPAVQVFRVVMLALLVVGALGVWLHYRGNVEFELEMYPTMKGWELFRKSMSGATPTLAAGLIAQIGLLGLACTYAHPALRGRVHQENTT